MWNKLVSILLVLGMLATAGCIIAPYPGHHGRVYRHRAVVGYPAPVVVRPGPRCVAPR